MARALLVADPLFAATTDNDVPEARPGQTSDDTLTASEPHRACGHGLDLLRPHAEKRMLKQETGTEMLPAQPRSDASHATEQAQEQAALQLRELGHAGQHTQHVCLNTCFGVSSLASETPPSRRFGRLSVRVLPCRRPSRAQISIKYGPRGRGLGTRFSFRLSMKKLGLL
jgi:hypothetical protein